MSEQRFHAWPAMGTGRSRAVQIVRTYDGLVFAMSTEEAYALAQELTTAADQSRSRWRVRRPEEDS